MKRKTTRKSVPLRIARHVAPEPIGFDTAPDHSGYTRRKLTLPAMPPGHEAPKMAMDWQGSVPGYLNTVPGAMQFGLYFPGYPYLAELAQRSEFRQPTETTAKELTRKWITFKSKGDGDKTKVIEGIEEDFRTYNVREVFRKAAMHDGFYGLGHVFMEFKGQEEEHELPLEISEKKIPQGSLMGFMNIEPMWTTPLIWNSNNPTRPDFYKPQSWMVLGRETHQSRMLRFVSREVPDIIKPAYNFGGISLSQLIQPYVERWLKTVASVNQLINNFSIITLLTDMTAVLQGGDNADLLRRVKMFAKTRANDGVFLLDKTRELLEQIAVPLSGLSELQAQAQEHMAAPTHLPLVVLTGITPAGLNASSEGEIEVYHAWLLGLARDLYGDQLDKVLQIIQLNRFGKIDPDITYEFVPLKELVGEAAARVYKTKAEAGVAYIDSGVIDAQEERQRLASDPDSGYVNLDMDKVIEPPLEEAAEENEEAEAA